MNKWKCESVKDNSSRLMEGEKCFQIIIEFVKWLVFVIIWMVTGGWGRRNRDSCRWNVTNRMQKCQINVSCSVADSLFRQSHAQASISLLFEPEKILISLCNFQFSIKAAEKEKYARNLWDHLRGNNKSELVKLGSIDDVFPLFRAAGEKTLFWTSKKWNLPKICEYEKWTFS